MGKIRILPEHEARKVAAGEVVERPSNIVKELVENSLDAHAKTISIYIKKSGKELVRVLDDGSGMSASDAWLCVQSHATSKITNIDDLLTITTFGFRGEALSSIAAVSSFSLKTWDGISDDGMGTQVAVSYGKHHEKTVINCPRGTDISVENLFDNIPVRKKFLKQDETEWNQIVGLVEAFALSHKNIHFKLFHDNVLALNLPPVNGVKDRVAQCWGYNFAENMVEWMDPSTELRGGGGEIAHHEEPDGARKAEQGLLKEANKHPWLKISGYISNHNFWRYNRNSIFFFVNNRWVKYQELSKAAMKGYANVLPPAKFPAVFIFIEVDAEQVDVNVHPKKEEVRFIHPVIVCKTIEQGIKNSLEKLLTSKIGVASKVGEDLKFQGERFDNFSNGDSLRWRGGSIRANEENFAQGRKQELPVRGPFDPSRTSGQDERIEGRDILVYPALTEEKRSFVSKGHPEPARSLQSEAGSKEANQECQNSMIEPVYELQEQGIFVGQLFNTYLLLEQKGELVFIDQHAAHERIMYERFKNIFGKHEGTQLLFPVTMSLSAQDITILLEHATVFALYGIEIDQAGTNSIVIKSTPSGLKNDCLIKELILETVSFIQENLFLEEQVLSQKITEHVHSQMACKAAVRAGDVLTESQIHQLLKDLSAVESRFICAHGRPTTWSVPKRDIEKNFKRC